MIKEVLDVTVELAESGMTMIVVTHEMGWAPSDGPHGDVLGGQGGGDRHPGGGARTPGARAQPAVPGPDPDLTPAGP